MYFKFVENLNDAIKLMKIYIGGNKPLKDLSGSAKNDINIDINHKYQYGDVFIHFHSSQHSLSGLVHSSDAFG